MCSPWHPLRCRPVGPKSPPHTASNTRQVRALKPLLRHWSRDVLPSRCQTSINLSTAEKLSELLCRSCGHVERENSLPSPEKPRKKGRAKGGKPKISCVFAFSCLLLRDTFFLRSPALEVCGWLAEANDSLEPRKAASSPS